MKISIDLNNLSLSDFADVEADELYISVPDWITCEDSAITLGEIASIIQSGCASAAYMPAVTYAIANDTMHEYGDDVLDYIEDSVGELPTCTGESWKGMAVHYLSAAIELWCSSVEDELLEAIQEHIINDEVHLIKDMWPNILQGVVDEYGWDDTVAINEAFNNWTDSLCKDGDISDYVYNNVTLEDVE